MSEHTDADLVDEQGVNGDAATPATGDAGARPPEAPPDAAQLDGTGNASTLTSGDEHDGPGQELSAGEG